MPGTCSATESRQGRTSCPPLANSFDSAAPHSAASSNGRDEGAREVVIDLGDVTFVDSTAVAALLEAGKRARRAGAALTVVCDDENVRRVLDLVGVRRVLRLADTVTAAFAEVGARGSAAASGQAA